MLNLALVLSRLSPRWCDPSRALASRMSLDLSERGEEVGKHTCGAILDHGSGAAVVVNFSIEQTTGICPLHNPLISEPEHVFL